MAREGVHASAVISSSAVLGDGVVVGPCAVIEDGAQIGAGTIIEAQAYVGLDVVVGAQCHIGVGAVLRDGVILDDNVRIASGAVLGTDGFGYVFDGNTHLKIPQVGKVHIGANTIVEAGACIDRATTGVTEIGADSHIGSMVMIGHNCKFGRGCHIGFQSGFAGSTVVGDNCHLGPQVGMAMRAELGNDCTVGFRSGVLRKISDGSEISGYPARPVAEVKKLEAAIMRLPKVMEELGL